MKVNTKITKASNDKKQTFRLLNGREYTREQIVEYVNEINGFQWE